VFKARFDTNIGESNSAPKSQLATFIPDWNKFNEQLASGAMDEDEYQAWLEDTLKLFNVSIDDYV